LPLVSRTVRVRSLLGRVQFGAETKQDWPSEVDVEDRGEAY